MAMNFRFSTLLVHGGLEPGPAGATTVPIVQSSSFAYDTAEGLEDVFQGRQVGQVYTRIGNPTTENLERRLALLDGGVAALATSSGMAAITTAVMTIVRAGDEILSSSSLFGGTFSLFRDTLANFGITTRFVDPTDLEGFRNAITERTRLLFVETVGNPKLDVPDVPALAQIAHDAGLPILVDATVTTPYLATGAALDADIVIHSTSKYINGTGNSIGGVIIDRGVFNWNSPLFPFRTVSQEVPKLRLFGPGPEADPQGCGGLSGASELFSHDRRDPDPGAPDGPPLRQRPGSGPVSQEPSPGNLAEVSGTGGFARLRGGVPALRWPVRRVDHLRDRR